MSIEINFWVVVLAAVASSVLGMIWYSKGFFGKSWAKMMGLTEEHMKQAKDKGMVKFMIAGLLLDLLLAYALAHFIGLNKVTTSSSLWSLVWWLWVGLMVPIFAGAMVWEKRPFQLFLINALYRLIGLMLMGYIILSFA